MSDETLNTGGIGSYGSYEKLKELIDPRPRLVTVNPKYGKTRRTMVHSSFLFLSNHSNALALTEDDRRFYVISNPHKPAPVKYFQELNAWLEELDGKKKPVWTENVYRWLMQRDVDLAPLLAPPPRTTGKDLMVQESRAAIDVVSHHIISQWPCEYMSAMQFTHAIEFFADRLDLYNIASYKAQIKRVFATATYPLAQTSVIKIDGKTQRVRGLICKATPETTPKGEALSDDDRGLIRADLIDENIKHTLHSVSEILDVEGL